VSGPSGPTLGVLGLSPGEEVRWRLVGSSRSRKGAVVRRERDGSVTIRDDDGGLRSVPVERIDVRREGRRGATGWEPLTTRAGRAEQLRLPI